ncbi:MAG: type II toxin-antitoxin system RelE/ParE family toxin [Sphaerospermopsis sp. SIO1G1]|nr:type II toxin-antitoxin system RelE/ParE family toxin [Sphaerospermopsis sp. SIO1G1]
MTEAKQYKLNIKKSARKELLKLQPKFFKQVMSKILSLVDNPKPQDYKTLQGYPNLYRVDQGEFRIIYEIKEEEIYIFRVGKRNDDEVYENL